MTESTEITALIIAAIPSTIASVLSAVMAVKIFNVSHLTHDLVNGSMLLQLRLHAKTARSKANITKDESDLVVADLAEQMLKEHENKRAIIDGSMDKEKVEV